jgi:hypothetical protein
LKKRFSFFFALVLALSLTTKAYAMGDTVSLTRLPESQQATIMAEFESVESEVPTNYDVTIFWKASGSLKYIVYTDTYVWDPDRLEYQNVGESGVWSVDDAQVQILVTNRSNVPIQADCSSPIPNASNGITRITGMYDRNNFVVDTCAPADAAQLQSLHAEAVTGVATYRLCTVEGDVKETGRIGTITVGIGPTGNAE